MKDKNSEKQKKMNPFLWFLFAIVFPLVIIITLAIVVMGVAGVNVIDWAKEKGNQIPVVSDIVTTDVEKETERNEQQAQANSQDKDNEIIELNRTIGDLEETVNLLEQEIVKLENSQTENIGTVEEGQTEQDSEEQGIDIVSSSYEEMKSDQAAAILQNLESDTAILILQEVSDEARGDILEAMDPEIAAEFTQALISNENN